MTSNAVVGDQQIRTAQQGHGDHDALFHAARELVRILRQSVLGVGDADHPQHFQHALVRWSTLQTKALPEHLAELLADREHGIQGRHGVLKDHGDLLAADLRELTRIHREEIAPLPHDGPTLDADPAGWAPDA